MKGYVILAKADKLIGCAIQAQDGEIGTVMDLYFDDEQWGIRYAVVKTGGWLKGRKVLLSPVSFVSLDRETRSLVVSLSRSEVENSPRWDSDKPVSREFEEELHSHFKWPVYWPPVLYYGYGGFAVASVDEELPDPGSDVREAIERQKSHKHFSHLRSFKEIAGYRIAAMDEEFGSIENMLYDDFTWNMAYFVVDTRKLLPGKKVLMSVRWVRHIRYSGHLISVSLNSDELKNAPEYDSSEPVTREYEESLHDYFDFNMYQ